MNNAENMRDQINNGEAVLGIELGSTRIKAVLLTSSHETIATGDFEWENRLEGGYWTYSLEDAWKGVRAAYSSLRANVKTKFDTEINNLKAIGFSGMMHGYLPFDQNGKQLAAFRTWRNVTAAEAAEKLRGAFGFNIPDRWSIAHLYQAVIDNEDHIADIDYVTTLAGYIHWRLTGEKVMGVGEASGMFPIDSTTNTYDERMIEVFNSLIEDKKLGWKLQDVLPKVCVAGEEAGKLTEEGVKLLDETGTLRAGIPMCPPEGDAGTGMVATNSVGKRTGNVSAGTSIFGMFVLEKSLSKLYPEIDMVTTPDGSPVAMIHANNCTSDLNAWVGLFKETLETFGCHVNSDELYGTLYRKALEGDEDCGKLMSYCYLSGESITKAPEGRPLFVRSPESNFNLANFMKSHLYSSLCMMQVGMRILENEDIKIDSIYGHGGIFRTKGVAQRFLAAMLNASVSVMETAGEGGPWGMAVLASYMVNREQGETLEHFLSTRVFDSVAAETITPTEEDVKSASLFADNYLKGMDIERAAGSCLF